MVKRLMFLILSLAVLLGMGLATSAAFAGGTLSGDIDWRWEGWKNADDWSSDSDDNIGYMVMRSRLGYSGEIGERGLFEMSIQNVRVQGGDMWWDYYYGPYPSKAAWGPGWNNHEIVLHEANMGVTDFLFDGFDAYAGRFSLDYGRGRVIGNNDWAFHDEHRFDGFLGHYEMDKGWFDLLCMKVFEGFWNKYNEDPEDYPGDWDTRGVYAHFDAAEGFYVEPYIFYTTMDNWGDEEDDGMIDNSSLFTFGALAKYVSDNGLSFYAEGLINTGTMVYGPESDDEYDLSQLGFYAGGAYEFASEVKPFIGAEFNYASGTKDDDEEDKTFRSPFGSYAGRNGYMGIMDMVDWANTASFRFFGGLTPVEGTDIKLDFYMFKLATDEDFAYGGYSLFYTPDYTSDDRWTPTPDADGNVDKNVGTEIDFFVDHQIDENVTISGGLGIFSFGDYFGPDNDYDSVMFGYLNGRISF